MTERGHDICKECTTGGSHQSHQLAKVGYLWDINGVGLFHRHCAVISSHVKNWPSVRWDRWEGRSRGAWAWLLLILALPSRQRLRRGKKNGWWQIFQWKSFSPRASFLKLMSLGRAWLDMWRRGWKGGQFIKCGLGCPKKTKVRILVRNYPHWFS